MTFLGNVAHLATVFVPVNVSFPGYQTFPVAVIFSVAIVHLFVATALPKRCGITTK